MGDKIIGIILLATGGAILGDFLAHEAATRTIFNGLGSVVGQTYQAAAGAYSR